MIEYRLTTIDNPFDPFTEFDEWIMYDKDKGYDSSEYLARIADLDEGMDENEKNQRINDAIDLIIERDPLKIYKKIEKKV